MLKEKLDFNFNDGLLVYNEKVTVRDEKTRRRIGEMLNEVGKLYFSYRSLSQSSWYLSDSDLSQSDVKLVTYFVADVLKSHKVVIDGTMYDIVKLDMSEDKKYLYWYLKKGGRMDD